MVDSVCFGGRHEEAAHFERGQFRPQSLMIATKRFNRHGLLISAVGHVGILVVALFFARAASQEAVPPDAMQVEIITPKEMPRYSGTPSTLRASGTEQAAQSQALTEKSEQPPTVPAPPQPKDQHQAQRNALRKPQEPQTAPQQAMEPPLPPAESAQVAMAQPDPAAEVRAGGCRSAAASVRTKRSAFTCGFSSIATARWQRRRSYSSRIRRRKNRC
jgi:outer membrane biosynthesis protein TonB